MGLCIPALGWAQNNALPVVSDIQATVNPAARTVEITYSVSDPDNPLVTVGLRVSNNDGLDYRFTPESVSGDVGAGVAVGTSKKMTWNYSNTAIPQGTGQFRFKVIADDGETVDVSAIVSQIDSSRMLSDLEFLASRPRHRVSEPEHLEASRAFIRERLSENGYSVYADTFRQSGGYLAENIWGTRPGLYHEDTVVIMDGHYDSVDPSPGADDNGSAVVGFLEAARVLAPYQFDRTVRFIGFDLEESGLLGAFQYVNTSRPRFEQVKAVLNFEMIGYYSKVPNSQKLPAGFNLLFPEQVAQINANQNRGDFITHVGSNVSVHQMKAFEEEASVHTPDLKFVSLKLDSSLFAVASDLLRSDHAAFLLNRLPAVMLTDGANFRNQNYHTANDLVETLNFTFMQQVVQAATATLIRLAGVRHATAAQSGAVRLEGLTTRPEPEHLPDALTVYPNPFDDEVTFRFVSQQHSLARIELLDVLGRSVQHWMPVPSGIYQLDVHRTPLPTGLYYVRATTTTGQCVTKPVVYSTGGHRH